MFIPESCRTIINRERINEGCEPNLEGIPLRQQVLYMKGNCDYLVDVIIKLLRLIKTLEHETRQSHPSSPEEYPMSRT